jgi:O-antigen/teichoic acid export membrane protein
MIAIQKKIMSLVGNKSLRNGVFFSLFSFINRGFTFLLLIILAKYIAPAEYGYLSLFATVVMLECYIICLSSEGYMSVSYFHEGKEQLKYAFSTIFFIGLSVTAILLAIVTIGGNWLVDILELPQHVLYIAVFISLFTALAHVNLDYFRLKEKVKIYGFFSCGNALLNFVVSIILVKYCLLSWQGRVYAQVGCYALFGFYAIWLFYSRNLITLDIKHKIKPIVKWSLPLIPHHATAFIRQGLDRYIINYSHTIADVGLFSFGLNLANVITMIGFGFNQSNSVEIYRILGDKEMPNAEKRRLIRRQKRTMVLALIACTILVALPFYFLVPIFLPRYAPSMNYFLILAVYGFLVGVYYLYANFLFFYKKTKMMMYITFASSLIHLMLSLLLTPISLYLTALVYCISQSCFVFAMMYFSNKTLRQTIGA